MPAERAICPPLPGFISTLCTMVPTGIEANGMALPGLMSTFSPETTVIAGLQPLRRQDVTDLAVVVFDKRDEGGPVGIVFEALDRRRHTSNLRRLKSTIAVQPLMAAAAAARGDPAGVVAAALDLVRPSLSALTGPPFHRPARLTSTRPRRPGVVGLNFFSAMASDPRSHVDAVTLFEGHVWPSCGGALAEVAAKALHLALLAQRVDGLDLDREQALHGGLDLGLAGIQRAPGR